LEPKWSLPCLQQPVPEPFSVNPKRQKLYKHKTNYLPKNLHHTTKIKIMIPKNNKQTKYQLIKEERPIKYKTTNKYQPEPAQSGTLNPKSKTK